MSRTKWAIESSLGVLKVYGVRRNVGGYKRHWLGTEMT